MDQGRSPLFGSLTVAVAASLFAMLGVLSRTAYGFGLTPFAFVTWRAGIGAVAMALVVVMTVRRGARLVGWRSLDVRARASLGVAALMGATLNMAMFLAFARVPVAIVLLGFYLYPAIVTGVSSLLGWEPMDWRRAIALMVALGGMVAVVVGGPTAGTTEGIDPIGVLLALSAAASQAVFVLVSRRGYRHVPTDQAMGFILAASALIAGILAVLGDGASSLELPFGTPALLSLLLFGGIFAAAVPSTLFLAGIRWIGPVRAGILMLIEPLVGVLLAALFLGEAIGPIQAAGGVAILSAAVLIQRARPAEPAMLPAGEPEPSLEGSDGPVPATMSSSDTPLGDVAPGGLGDAGS
ncbi:MAG: EamA family transporter [Chloroflexi bacterium]|nr:EamA family transporter [Chloroflexota bacterium]